MNKKHKEAINEALSRALEAPKRKPSPALNDILSEFAPDQQTNANSQAPHATSDGQSPSGGQTTTVPLSTPAPPKPVADPIAPERDFNRRANSLERYALPSGLFPGSSKKIYDALYLRTRGAVKPCRTVRATKKDIADWSGIKNRKTIDGHLRYLETCRLIQRRWELGNTEGYLFEVRLPEETSLMDRGGQRDRPPEGADQKTVRGTDQKTASDGQSKVSEDSTTSGHPKTFIKTNTERDDDDAALASLILTLKRAAEEVTGRELSATERDRWGELGEVLATELKIAAARTTVSSAPSFLAEHLRRRLWKKDKRELLAEASSPAAPASQTSPLSAEQVKNCPDCGGTGFRYKGENFTGGVEKCRHEKLTANSAPSGDGSPE